MSGRRRVATWFSAAILLVLVSGAPRASAAAGNDPARPEFVPGEILMKFRNLDAFSPDAVKPLVELGLSSKNSDIQALCRKYREKIQSSRSTTGV